MKNEKLAFVEDKIRDLVPRLKELSFGCEVMMDQISGDRKFIERVTHDEKYGSIFTQSGFQFIRDGDEFLLEDEHFDSKIIGHPIQLEDVLEAIENGTEYYLSIESSWEDKIVFRVNGIYESFIYWEYGKPLSEQSEELINFLYDLLK